ncbi:MAG: hypothetical protein E3J77_02860 [Actinobacteria bacterium]|nr:MAG: hypothetical protein E3J77_02860 [Actinomycetota bacterium]
MSAAIIKANYYSIYGIRRIENMLKNGVEDKLPNQEDSSIQLNIEDLKFLRNSSSFNHYKSK